MSSETKPVVHETTETEIRTPPQYKVLLHNDDVNDMLHVVLTLVKVFNFKVEKAIQIMTEAHMSSVALCKVEPLEHAEFHQEQLQSASLTATIEPDA